MIERDYVITNLLMWEDMPNAKGAFDSENGKAIFAMFSSDITTRRFIE